MAVSKMRDRVSIEREVRVSNGQGGYDRTWQEIEAVYAEIEGQSGNEAMNAAVERSMTRWRVTMRETDVTAKDRLIWTDKANLELHIKSAMPHRKHRGHMLLLCESGAVA